MCFSERFQLWSVLKCEFQSWTHCVLTRPCVEAILLCLTQSITIFSMELKWFFSPAFCPHITIPVVDPCDPQSTSVVSIFLLCVPLQLKTGLFCGRIHFITAKVNKACQHSSKVLTLELSWVGKYTLSLKYCEWPTGSHPHKCVRKKS